MEKNPAIDHTDCIRLLLVRIDCPDRGGSVSWFRLAARTLYDSYALADVAHSAN